MKQRVKRILPVFASPHPTPPNREVGVALATRKGEFLLTEI